MGKGNRNRMTEEQKGTIGIKLYQEEMRNLRLVT